MGFFAPMAGAAAMGLLGGLFGKQKPTPDQQRRQELINQLMASLSGQGPYADLFRMDQEAFQKSYVDPMKQMYKSQWVPQIQQSYIASGMQRGSGMEDQLARAGVDLDQMLNQQYAGMMSDAQNRKLQALIGAMGAESGMPAPSSFMDRFAQGAIGSLYGGGAESIGGAFADMMPVRDRAQGSNPKVATSINIRKGFE